jgi:sugar phosphate isomerase/epimerase
LLNGRPRADVLGPIRAGLEARGLGAVVHAPLSLEFMDAANADLHRAVGAGSIAVCEALGARRMVVHPAWVERESLRRDRDRLMAMERDGLRALADVAGRAGVTLCLENMPPTEDAGLDNHGLDCRSVAAQIAAVDHPHLAATLDVSHAYIASRHFGWDLRDQLAALAPVTRHLHLHDSFGRVPILPRPRPGEGLAYGQGDLHLPLGWGDLPWTGALAGLPLPEEVSVTLEIAPAFATPEAVADSVRRARALAAGLSAGDSSGA